MDPIVIVGTGLAGYTVAREFRRQDKKAPLVMVTADGGDYYSKPALSNALAQGRAPAALVLNTAEQMARALRAEVLVRKPVAAIDREARRIRLEGGELAYSKVVLALGSRCNRPPVGGALTDKFGRKQLILFGLIFSALSTLTFGLVTEYSILFPLMVFVGLLSSIAHPAHDAGGHHLRRAGAVHHLDRAADHVPAAGPQLKPDQGRP